jgi:lipopolysaccharide/colanic/teichoic acid biosynthesis glycosyltransferase
VKRALDIGVALLLLLMGLPLLMAVAAAVFFDSGRPILFRQTRVGKAGVRFSMLKFRSMHAGAAKGAYFTEAGDVRITRVGRFIRRTSLDELPQIWNVLRGDMSLVGPRPDLPLQEALYAPADWSERCRVRPGITGLAQVRGRSEASFAQRVALDLQYSREASFRLDMAILWQTLLQVSGKRAN